MSGWSWLDEGVTYLVIALALLAGLAASYGRELEAQRRPNRSWWIRRLLIMPLLAIAATAATELLDLPASAAAFSAAMLSLGGYDAICLLERRWHRTTEVVGASLRRPDGSGGSHGVRPWE